MSDWLEKLTVGDKVIVKQCGFGQHNSVEVIERFTKTQVILKGLTAKFNRSTGRQVGGSQYHTSNLWEATQDRVDKIIASTKKRRQVNKLEGTKWDKVSIETLQKVYNVLMNEIKGEKDV